MQEKLPRWLNQFFGRDRDSNSILPKHVTHGLNHKFAEIALYVTTKPMCIKKENYPYLIVRVHYLFIGVRAGVKHDDCNVISTYH